VGTSRDTCTLYCFGIIKGIVSRDKDKCFDDSSTYCSWEFSLPTRKDAPIQHLFHTVQ
jgi:hypothetical protein